MATVAPCSGRTVMTTPDDAPAPEHQEGDAADAIRSAEVALVHQPTTAQVDLQVVTAVLNAHQKTAAGTQALNRLQRDIEAGATRSDLDTPAGARDFQRYLIGKLRDIRAVVAGASLDDTSNSALMAAWTSSARPVEMLIQLLRAAAAAAAGLGDVDLAGAGADVDEVAEVADARRGRWGRARRRPGRR